METILNLVWLGVTLAVLWLWRFRWATSRPNQRNSQKLEAVAMICFIALLFPVISLTDDLHPEIVAVDAVSGKRNAYLIVASGAQSAHLKPCSNSHFAYIAPSPLPVLVELVFAGAVPPTPIPPTISVGATRFGRSPPSLA